MFLKSEKGKVAPAGAKAASGKPAGPSILSADMRIVGNIISDGEIQMDGTIDGDIKCAQLTIGAQAATRGEVVADGVHVHGTVTGQIRARSIFLAKTSRVCGDVVHETLAIEPGAYIEGHVRRFDGNDAREPARKAGPEGGDGKFNVVVGEGGSQAAGSKPASADAAAQPAQKAYSRS